MKATFLWCGSLLWCFLQVLPAQSSLPKDAVLRVDSLNNLSFDQKGEPARRCAEAAMALALRINYRKGLADSYLRMGRVESQARHWQESEAWYRSALAEREKLGNHADIASCYNQLGNLSKQQGQYDTAAAMFRKGLTVMQQQPPHLNTIYLHNNLANVYRLLGRYEQTREHLLLADTVYDQLRLLPLQNGVSANDLAFGQASVRLNLAEFMQTALSQYGAAAQTLKECLHTFDSLKKKDYIGKCWLLLGNNAYDCGRLDSAKTCYEQAIALGDSLLKQDLYTCYRNRGRVNLEQGKGTAALDDFRRSLAAFEQLDDRQQVAAGQFEIGNYFYERAQLDSAIGYYQLALGNDIQDPKLKGRVLYFLSDALYSAGQGKAAAEYSQQYVHLLETLNTGQSSGAFTEMTVQLLDKNRLLRKIAVQEKQTQKTYGLVALGILTLFVLIALLGARIQRQKRRIAEHRAEMAQQEEQLARQDAENARQRERIERQEKIEILKSREVETAYARLEAQDEMQQKIGRELHDNIGALLTTVRLRLAPVDEVLDVLPGSTRQNFQTANHLLQEACEELRRVSHQLSSATLMQFGLEPQLRALADNTPLELRLELFGLEKRLNFNIELNIYRIIQELVQNVVKHAQAKTIIVAVNRFQDRVNILVEDDGCGFDPEQVRDQPGIGLRNLAARLNELNGQMEIDSAPRRGTIVIIDIALNN